MATTSIQRSRTAGTTKTKFTISMWFKRSALNVKYLIANYTDDNNRAFLQFDGSNKLYFASKYSGTNYAVLETKRQFQDPNAWYHIVLNGDTTTGSAADMHKLYVNGVRETALGTTTNPSGSDAFYWNEATTNGFRIGEKGDGSDYFDGLMSHVHFCDGYAYEASAFGSTDSVTGEWQINTSPSVSYGTNGFFLKMEDSSNMDLDSSSNALTFTTNGSLTKTEDCPSNVFCAGNPLAVYGGNLSYSNRNTTITGGSSWQMGSATMGASKGKYYFEYKITTLGSGGGYHKLGFISDEAAGIDTVSHNADTALDGGYAFYFQNGDLEVRTDSAVITGYDGSTLGISLSLNDIMCLAVDMDNKRAYMRKNDGAWIKSGDPVAGTNGLDISADYTTGKRMIPAYSTYENGVGSLNFGDGYFGTTAVSSAGTNASGIGIFEYDVPTGYTALSTKGLNE